MNSRLTVLWLFSGLLLAGCASRVPNVSESSDVPVFAPPAPDAFVFGSGDVVEVKVWRQQDMDMVITIAPDGAITYPLLGRVVVAGMTYPELVSTLEEGLAAYYTDPSVAVNIVELSSQKVFVLGEVKTPAVLQIENEMSILEALTRTGGINPDARTDNVLLIRGGLETPELFRVDVSAIYGQGDFTQMVYLERGDIVMVPTKTIVNVDRYFRHVQGALSPIVGGTVIYRNVFSGGGAQGSSSQLD